MPQAQTGADVTVLPSAEFRFQPDVQDSLRLVAGLEITQVGQLGSSTGLNIRGAANDANKVLIDGVPANAIGGNVEFANLANRGYRCRGGAARTEQRAVWLGCAGGGCQPAVGARLYREWDSSAVYLRG